MFKKLLILLFTFHLFSTPVLATSFTIDNSKFSCVVDKDGTATLKIPVVISQKQNIPTSVSLFILGGKIDGAKNASESHQKFNDYATVVVNTNFRYIITTARVSFPPQASCMTTTLEIKRSKNQTLMIGLFDPSNGLTIQNDNLINVRIYANDDLGSRL